MHAAGSAGDQYEEAESSEAISDAEAVLGFVDVLGAGPRAMIAAVAERRRERQRLLARAAQYADALAGRLDLRTAIVAGSVARGDFN